MKKIICPNCGKEVFFCGDEWGYTMLHLHCDQCRINIGTNKFDECEELLQSYHEPNTYLEYYHKKIQLLVVNGQTKIDTR